MPLRTYILILIPIAFLAGCTTGGGMDHGSMAALDTGDIASGATRTLTFASEGTRDLHCDPHPFMEHSVTVEAGAPMTAHVHITDGATSAEYTFEPQEITVGPGAVVTYHNHGALVHTASEMSSTMQH